MLDALAAHGNCFAHRFRSPEPCGAAAADHLLRQPGSQAGKTRLRRWIRCTCAWGPHPHASSPACAAFFGSVRGLLHTVASANGRQRVRAGGSEKN